MSPNKKVPESCATAEELRLIQKTLADAIAGSMDEITQSKLSGGIALMLMRVAFAETLRDLLDEEAQACEIEIQTITMPDDPT